LGFRTDGTFDHERSFRTSSRQLQDEFNTYVRAQAKLNIYDFTAEVRRYATVNDTASRDESRARIVRSDDEEDTETIQ